MMAISSDGWPETYEKDVDGAAKLGRFEAHERRKVTVSRSGFLAPR